MFFEDPLAPAFSESWLALRRATRLPIMTGENIELAERPLPFLQNQAVDCLQPDLINSGGITGTKMIADLAGAVPHPDLPAQRQRPGAEHGLAAVLGGHLQLPDDGMPAQRRPGARGGQQRAGDPQRAHEGLDAARPGPGSRPGLPEGQPGRRRAVVGGVRVAVADSPGAPSTCPAECRRDAGRAPEAASNASLIRNGRMVVSMLPGLGLDLDQDNLKATGLTVSRGGGSEGGCCGQFRRTIDLPGGMPANCGRAPEAASNAPFIRNGRMVVSIQPGLGLDLDQDYLKANLADGEPWWGNEAKG